MRIPTLSGMTRNLFAFMGREKHIKKQVKKNKSVVYGSQAITRQIGIYSREPSDYDVLSRKPGESARQLEKKLDKQSGRDVYYATPSKFHKGTHKVYHKGKDMRKGTRDDIGVADFTTMRPIKTVTIKGIKYAWLGEIIKDKKKTLKDPMFKFRWAKDREDIERIKSFKRMRRFL